MVLCDMKKIYPILPIFLTLLFIIGSLFFLVKPNKADNATCPPTCNDAGDSCIAQFKNCVSNLSSALTESQNATKPLLSQLQSMQQQIAGIKDRVATIEQDVTVQQQQIDDGYKNLNAKKALLDHAISNFYIKQTYNSPLLVLFSGKSAAEITQLLQYQKVAADEDKQIITNIAVTINDLQQQQQALEAEKSRLSVLKATLDDQSAKLDKIVAGAQQYQAVLASQIAQLSSQQQVLLAAKYASLGIPTTAYTSQSACSSDISPSYRDPGFSGTKFGFFTYGVYHRVGMSQYGAEGRADKGQSYQQILSFYYPNTQIVNAPTSSTSITVNGTNDYGETFNNQQYSSIENYLQYIYEMPATGANAFPTEALKAQAVAARTYAYQAVLAGRNPVAPNQSFQEIKQTNEPNSQAWINAVNATSGQVLESGGQPITAWFSSTGGGYTHNSGDVFGSSTSYTTTAADASGPVNSWSDLQNNAYDGPNYANSPWFYCDWGGRAQYNKTAWLQSSEVADIVNTILLAQADSSTAPHLSQPDGNVPNTWSPDQVKSELQSRGITPFNSISNVSVNPDFSSGRVTQVTVSGDAGTRSFSGDTFVTYFDVRAPGNIFIPALRKNGDGSYTAPLFNVEMR